MTNTSENEAFVRRIIENPDDDTPRLVYADWLDENGRPERAEFIRLAIGSHESDDEGELVRSRRYDDLLRDHGTGWAAEAGLAVPGVKHIRFHRGFIEEVDATASAFARDGSTWIMRTPLRFLHLSGVAGRGPSLTPCRHLAAFERLYLLDRRVGDADLLALVRSPYLTLLNSLSIGVRGWLGIGRRSGDHVAQVGADGLAGLARSPLVAQLVQLTLTTRHRLGPVALTTLADADVGRLRGLTIHTADVRDDGAAALASGRRLVGLKHLELNHVGMGDEGMLALLGSPMLRGLSGLDLSNNGVTAAGLSMLNGLSLPHGLRRIVLLNNPIGEIDVAAIVRLLANNPLLYLDMDACRIPAGQRADLLRAAPDRVYVNHVPERSRGPSIS